MLDGIQPLEEYNSIAGKDVAVFTTRTATLWNYYGLIEEQGDAAYKAKNPDFGAYLNLYLKNDPKEAITIAITDAKGNMVRNLKDTVSKAGVNRIIWDLRYTEEEKLKNPVASGWGGSPLRVLVSPGVYTAAIKANGQTVETKITVRPDPRIKMSEQDFKMKTETTLALRDQLSQTHKLINRTDETIKQLTELKQRIESAGNESGVDKSTQGQIDEAIKKLKEYEDEVLRRPPPNMGYRQRPRLKEEISDLADAVDGATARPTQPQLNRLGELNQETEEATTQLNRIIEENIIPINEKVKNLPQVITDKSKKL
ncbi:MAG: hypothetical protein U5K54_11510 [Cytophagales bacterium]|nr:hypothetical protein [Cytophagales bacterium]